MPCSDGGIPYPPSKEELLDRQTPAMLCAIFSALSPTQRANAMQEADWTEAGVSLKEFSDWWKMHQVRDSERRAQEARQKKAAEARAEAMSKLSPAERKALGLGK